MSELGLRRATVVPAACALMLGIGCGGGGRGRDGWMTTGVTAGGVSAGGSGADGGEDSGDDGGSDASDDDDDDDDADSPFDDDGPDSGGDGPTLPPPDDDCATVSESATTTLAPVDVIVVVDNSGSMDAEAAAVQANLNGFSQQIIDSGIDVHVVLLSSYPGQGNGICVAPPLGGGGCPGADDNQPTFLHVNQEIGSADALFQVLGRYGAYSSVLREDSIKHVVVVSDDNSALPAPFFDQGFKDLHPSHESYVLHGIVALHDCSEAASLGLTYMDLANQTGGVLGDLCDQDFQPVFDQLSTEVIQNTPLGCAWEIPPPPDGMDLDPTAVNVEFDGGAGAETIGAVDGPWECANVTDGWFYDDPASPTKIHVCPQTCDRIQAASEGTIDIVFGCETQVAPPAG